MRQTFFITGTNTGVGKTALTCLLTGFLFRRGLTVAALKPLCSGGRADAYALYNALRGGLSLDEINPWHFRTPLAPALAARLEKKSVKLTAVVNHIRQYQKTYAATLVEGAGGLLSPLGLGFDSRNLLVALRATPLVVAQNHLGAVNHVLLTLEALPAKFRAQACVILMSPQVPDHATATNIRLITPRIAREKIICLPWLGQEFDPVAALQVPQVCQALTTLTKF